MKVINFYKNSSGNLETVKIGFSWPAFFFGVLWMLSKRLWQWAGLWFSAYVFVAFAESVAKESDSDALPILVQFSLFLAYLVLWLVPAFRGNRWAEERLQRSGYHLVHTNKDLDIAENDDDPHSVFGTAWSGNSSELSKLLREGADINQRNSKGHSALDLATARGDMATAKMLLQNGGTGRLL